MQTTSPVAKTWSPGRWLVLAMLCTWLVQVLIAWLPEDLLVGPICADDCFLYLNIARHLALGHGPTFDGLHLTNGFHPLYMTVLVPLATLFPEPSETLLHLALTFLATCSVLTAIPLYLIGRQLWAAETGLAVGLFWLFNPWVLVVALLGTEVALCALLVTWTVWLYLNARGKGLGWGHVVLVGAFGGLCVLARSDTVFLLGAMGLDMAVRLVRQRRWQHLLTRSALYGLAAAAVIAPWFLWNYATFGTIVQDSGTAIFYRTHYGATTTEIVARNVLIMGGAYLVILAFFLGPPVALLGLGLVRRPRRRAYLAGVLRRQAPLAWVWLYVGGLVIWYAGLFWSLQYWYFLPMLAALTAYLAGPAYLIGQRPGAQTARRLAGLTAFLLVTTGLVGTLFGAVGGFYGPASDLLAASRWLEGNTPPTTRVGAWNGGIIGYFSRRIVINLDGVVNHDVLRYYQEHNAPLALVGSLDYIRAQRIEYLLDPVYPNIEDDSRQLGGVLEPVYRIPGSELTIYRVRP